MKHYFFALASPGRHFAGPLLKLRKVRNYFRNTIEFSQKCRNLVDFYKDFRPLAKLVQILLVQGFVRIYGLGEIV